MSFFSTSSTSSVRVLLIFRTSAPWFITFEFLIDFKSSEYVVILVFTMNASPCSLILISSLSLLRRSLFNGWVLVWTRFDLSADIGSAYTSLLLFLETIRLGPLRCPFFVLLLCRLSRSCYLDWYQFGLSECWSLYTLCRLSVKSWSSSANLFTILTLDCCRCPARVYPGVTSVPFMIPWLSMQARGLC